LDKSLGQSEIHIPQTAYPKETSKWRTTSTHTQVSLRGPLRVFQPRLRPLKASACTLGKWPRIPSVIWRQYPPKEWYSLLTIIVVHWIKNSWHV